MPAIRDLGIWSIQILFVVLLQAAGGPSIGAQEVAITFDDLPAHGPLPTGVTREDVTRKILAAFKDAKVPEVYGFVNAGKLDAHPEDLKVLNSGVKPGSRWETIPLTT